MPGWQEMRNPIQEKSEEDASSAEEKPKRGSVLFPYRFGYSVLSEVFKIQDLALDLFFAQAILNKGND